MSHRSLLTSVLLALVACEEEPVLDPGLEATLEGRLERDPSDPSRWVGKEMLTVLDASGGILCEDEIELEGIDRQPCPDCEVTVEVLIVADAVRCLLAAREQLTRADGHALAFVSSSKLGPVRTGWLEAAPTADGPWEAFAEGLLDSESLAWHVEAGLEHTTEADLVGGEPETTSGGPPSR